MEASPNEIKLTLEITPTLEIKPTLEITPTLKLRLEAAQAAQERTRIAFFATTLISLAILIGVWNAYLSSYRAFAIQHHENIPTEATAPGAKKLQQELLSQWVQSRFITISLIGVHVGIGDAPLLGGIALLISTTWFYLSIRRENYNIGRIAIDSADRDKNLLWHIYYAINSYTIFTRVIHSDAPISNIEGEQPKNEELSLLTKKRSLINLLYYLPVIATTMALIFDVLSVYTHFFRAGFRYPDAGKPLVEIIRNADPTEEPLLWLWWTVTAAILFFLFRICNRTARFAAATESVIAQLLRKILPGEDTSPAIPPE